jgi:CRP-like cAMP-binding protein
MVHTPKVREMKILNATFWGSLLNNAIVREQVRGISTSWGDLMNSSSSLIKNVYLFKTLTPTELEAVAAIGQSQTFMGGDTIFLKGERATALYLIKQGAIAIQQSTKSGDTIQVATLGSGSHFGEMAFVDAEIRSATATATDRGEMIIIPYDKLQQLLNSNAAIAVKLYRELAHFLAGRLRVTTSDLSYIKEKNLTHF